MRPPQGATGRPVAGVETELRAAGTLALGIGLAGLVASIALGASPARALVPFAVAALVVGGVSGQTTAWLRRADGARPARAGVRVEPAGQTLRRSLVASSLGALAIVVALAVGGGLGAVLGGVLAGIGAVDLINLRSLRRRRRARGEELLRELGPSPFAGGRRPLYTRPT